MLSWLLSWPWVSMLFSLAESGWMSEGRSGLTTRKPHRNGEDRVSFFPTRCIAYHLPPPAVTALCLHSWVLAEATLQTGFKSSHKVSWNCSGIETPLCSQTWLLLKYASFFPSMQRVKQTHSKQTAMMCVCLDWGIACVLGAMCAAFITASQLLLSRPSPSGPAVIAPALPPGM